jgi:hypothetical protein
MGFIILLPWTTHLQHKKQSTKSIFKTKQLCIQTMILYKGRRCFSRSQTPLYILIKRKQVKKLPKNYPSHGSPCDCTINHKEQNHMVPHVIPHLITKNKITWFFHNNKKETQTHGAHDFQINMWKSMHHDQIQLLNLPL